MDDQHIYGSGASDMQAGVACCLNFIKTHTAALLNRYRVMIILYDKEEGTPLHENMAYMNAFSKLATKYHPSMLPL